VATQVGGRRRVDVDLKPLDRLAHGGEGTGAERAGAMQRASG
jgi:hypothetical protein